MASNEKTLKARSPGGFADRSAADIRATEKMVATIRRVYERYGFEPVETPLVEYTEALGKFLPDQDRPNEGVFSFRDEGDDENSDWLSLRYDLTAPLARYVAANYDKLPKPYRSYRVGWVFRNEKPGPGRFRQFLQFDADTVGAASPAADAEMCMMMADVIEELGIPRGQYVIKVNSRKVLDGVMEAIGLAGDGNAGRRLTALRAIDKLDRIGIDGVRELLGRGRKDESGDFTKGAELTTAQVDALTGTFSPFTHDWQKPFAIKTYEKYLLPLIPSGVFPKPVEDGLDDLEAIRGLLRAPQQDSHPIYGPDRIRIDPSVVRGLEYYTGAVFEAELLAEIANEKGQPVVFGSVGGGGRYDGLVGRFMKDNVPATGFSIGVSRLQAALSALGKLEDKGATGPVVVTVMDESRIGDYQKMVADLRKAGISAELYLGKGKFGAQMKYADRRGAPLVVIQGENEHNQIPPVVQIKDMRVGKALSAVAEDRQAWTDSRSLSQQEWPVDRLVEAVSSLLGRAS